MNNQPHNSVNELLLIEQLGIPVKKIRTLRPDGVVVLTANGVFWPLADAQALASHFNVALSLPDENPDMNAIETVTVCSVANGREGHHFPNKQIINCVRYNGEVIQVKVTDSSKYRRTLRPTTHIKAGTPMVLNVQRSKAGNWWNHLGRDPKHPGQW